MNQTEATQSPDGSEVRATCACACAYMRACARTLYMYVHTEDE